MKLHPRYHSNCRKSASQGPTTLMPLRSNHGKTYSKTFQSSSSEVIGIYELSLSACTNRRLSESLNPKPSSSKPLMNFYVLYHLHPHLSTLFSEIFLSFSETIILSLGSHSTTNMTFLLIFLQNLFHKPVKLWIIVTKPLSYILMCKRCELERFRQALFL